MTEKQRLTMRFVAAQALDILTTMIAVWLLGGRELNPLIKIMPLWKLLFIKAIVVFFIVIFLSKCSDGLKEWHYLLVVGISMIPVVINTLQISTVISGVLVLLLIG